jgi:hypothetical protein
MIRHATIDYGVMCICHDINAIRSANCHVKETQVPSIMSLRALIAKPRSIPTIRRLLRRSRWSLLATTFFVCVLLG